MYRLLDKFSQGCATAADLDLLEQLCDLTLNASLCGLGQSARPVLSTLRYFRDEYWPDAPVRAGAGAGQPAA